MNEVKACCHVYQTVVQSVANNTDTIITFTSEAYDPFGWHSTVTNTGRITPNIPGTYFLVAQTAWDVNTAGDRVTQLRRNAVALDTLAYGAMPSMKGTVLAAGMSYAFGTASANGTTDYFEHRARQNSGGALNTLYSAGLTNSYFMAFRIGD